MVECVIAEDEELLRNALMQQMGQAWPEMRVVAQCEDGASALEAIAQHRPDVAFLDIRMPGLTGIEVAAALGQVSPRTQVVFVTAYDQYAIDAFEQGAVDYLLKPVAADRLQATVQRLQARAAGGRPDPATLDALLQQLARRPAETAPTPPLAWITASSGRETRLIMLDDVAYFRADSKYTVVVTAEGESLLRTPLKELLAVLDPRQFRQIHRSVIVNLKAVASVVREDSGKGELRLRGGTATLPVSAPYMALFRGM